MSPPRIPATALTVTGLRKSFAGRTAVDGLSLAVGHGEILALLGPNGAGKTTTVEICEGFTQPDAGEVRVLGINPTTNPEALRPRIGVMLQGGGAYPSARAGEMLGLVASYSADPLDPRWLLDVLGLTSVAKVSCRRLSGGQQQRLALACALVGRPELVFLDEPTAGMDTQARHLVWDLLRALRRDGVTAVLTTHLLDEAEALADHVVIIDNGREVASGSPRELTHLGAEQSLRFDGPAGLSLANLRAALPAELTVSEPTPGSYLIAGTIDPQVLAAVTNWCAGLNVMPGNLRVDRRSLEDVFLELTGKEVRP